MRGKTTFHIRWKLFFYDVIVFAVTSVFLLVLYEGPVKLTQRGKLQQMLLAFVCVFACRLVGKIYGQIWRYGGIQCYMRLVCTDCVAFLIYVILESVLPVAHISFPRLLALSTVNTMGALIMRMSYRYAYKCSNLETFSGKILAALLKIFAGIEVGGTRDDQKIKVAIIGAGNVGVTLAGELIFRIFMICAVFFMEYLSASRTGMISCIIVCTIYVLNKRMAWIKVAGVIVLLFIGYFFLPQNVVLSIDQGINEFVYKNNATSILDSREETLELYYSKFNEEPLFGTGFMVPYDPEIRDYTLNFDLVVEPGNLLWTLLGDTGIIGVLIFILLFLVLLFNGGISRVYLIAAVFLICMGEMVFFSVNNMAVIIYLVLAVYVFENGKYNPTNTLKLEK